MDLRKGLRTERRLGGGLEKKLRFLVLSLYARIAKKTHTGSNGSGY